LSVELQSAGQKSFQQEGQELAAEEAAERLDGKKEVELAWCPPSLPAAGQASGGHDTVDMGMVFQSLIPGVQDGEESDAHAEPFGVGRDLGERFGNGAEQNAIDDPWVLQGQRR
jgi:hypothetical protein